MASNLRQAIVKVSAATSSASARVGVRRIAYASTGRSCAAKRASKRASWDMGVVVSVTVTGRPKGPPGSRRDGRSSSAFPVLANVDKDRRIQDVRPGHEGDGTAQEKEGQRPAPGPKADK